MVDGAPATRLIAPLLCLCLLTAACAATPGDPATGDALVSSPSPSTTPSTTSSTTPSTTTPSVGAPTPASEPPASATPVPTSTPVPEPTPEFPAGPLVWEPCGGSFECASLTVPVDHADPDGETLDLAVIRVPAADPDRRIGSVLFNPGGPGAPGTGFLRNLLGALPGVEQRFDIVSWDPRGVGDSAGLRCVDDVAASINRVETPDDGFADDLASLVATNVEVGAMCLEVAGDLLDNVGTVATARDLDVLRRALGDEQLTYVGYSYGTRIGAVYASLFPHRVRALVLDGAFPPGLESADLAHNVVDLEATLGRIDRTCALEPNCAVRSPGVIAAVERLLDDLDAQTPGDPLGLTERSALVGATLLAIYVPSTWENYTIALADALNGDLELIERFADFWFSDDGDFSDIYRGSNLAIMCADRAYPVERGQAFDELLGALPEAPILGPMFLGSTCEGWPVDGEALPVGTDVAVPAVVIGNTHDPATPLRWAQQLVDELPGSSLVTFVGDGHTIAGRGNVCIDLVVERFLVELTAPPVGARCRAPTGILGVTVTETAEGVSVTGLTPDGPAARAGIMIGDLIVELDGRAATGIDDLAVTAGQPLELTVQRDGERRSWSLIPQRRPWTLGD